MSGVFLGNHLVLVKQALVSREKFHGDIGSSTAAVFLNTSSREWGRREWDRGEWDRGGVGQRGMGQRGMGQRCPLPHEPS